MKASHDASVADRRAAERRLWSRALAVSLVLHALVFAFWRTQPLFMSPFAAAGPRANDDRAAAGSMQALQIRTPPPRPIVPPLVPLPTVTPPQEIVFDDEVQVDIASVMGEGPGELEGPGLADGTGRGDGGNAPEGLFRLIPPTPRGMIMPPTNRSLRGQQVEVWVFVDEAGRVVADSTRLRPPTADRSFNRRLIEEAAEWVFEPAQRGGQPVAAWFPYTISM